MSAHPDGDARRHIEERASTATVEDLLTAVECETCRPFAAAQLARRALHPAEGQASSTHESILAPCPYCTCLMPFPHSNGETVEAECYRCGRPLKLTWTETSVVVRVDQRRMHA